MKKPIILYVVITIICIIALIMGIYYQFFRQDTQSVGTQGNILPDKSEEDTVQTQEELKAEFNTLFTNRLDKKGFNTANIEKVNQSKDIIYPITMVNNEASYEMDVNIPVFNITGDIPNEFNNTTQQTFINKANQIITGENNSSQNQSTNQATNDITNSTATNTATNTITIDTTTTTRTLYDVSYQAYINGNILSVIIKSSLKEGSSPQRVMVQTYNYNLATKQRVELSDIIEPYGLTEDEINTQIKEVTKEAAAQEEVLASAGYETYKRDLENPIYQIENIHTFFLGANGELYIVFAYGNNNYTAEMDIIKMNTYPEIGSSTNSTQTQNSNTTINNTNNIQTQDLNQDSNTVVNNANEQNTNQ